MDPSRKHKLLLKSKLRKKKPQKTTLILDDSLEKKEPVKATIVQQPQTVVDINKTLLVTKKKKAVAAKSEDKQEGQSQRPITLKVIKQPIQEVASSLKVATGDIEKKLDTKALLDAIEPIDFTSKDMFYSYKPNLNTNMDDLKVIKPNENYYVCMYRINTSGLKPFLEYCFHKDKSDLLSFPILRYKAKKSVQDEGSDFIKYIFQVEKTCDFFLRIKEGHNYLFYEIPSPKTYNVEFKKRKSQWWWALMTEIINYKKIMQFHIHPHIYSVFTMNPSLIYLKDSEHNIIEVPEVGFHGTYFDLLNFISTFGLRPSTLNAMLGPYYYFGTFRKAVRYAGWTSTYKSREVDGEMIADEKGRYKRGGIARFAVFLGRMKALLNHPQDNEDWSDLVTKRIKDEPRNADWEKLTIKLHDHNGKWAEEYNSIYVGRVKLRPDRGGLFMKNPEFVVKSFEQQFILTTHELDQKTLKDKWDGNYEHYNIL